MASRVAQWWRICMPMQDTWVTPLGQEDPLEEETAAHSSTPACKILWQTSLKGYSPWGHKTVAYHLGTKQQQQQQCQQTSKEQEKNSLQYSTEIAMPTPPEGPGTNQQNESYATMALASETWGCLHCTFFMRVGMLLCSVLLYIQAAVVAIQAMEIWSAVWFQGASSKLWASDDPSAAIIYCHNS